jgi:hypothetical protein
VRQIALGALVALASTAWAVELPGEVDVALRLFAEPAPSQTVVVVTPSVSASLQPRRWLSVGVDWNADVVTGATPRTYGRPDVVTGATSFSDLRNALGAHAEAQIGPFAGQVGYRFGIENDYRSHVLELGARLDLFQHNTSAAVRYAHNFDSVCDLDNRGLAPILRQPLGTSSGCFSDAVGLTTLPLAVDAVELALAQVLTPRLQGALVAYYEHLDGFQSNPYRRVRLQAGIEAQESHPRLRDRGALGARARLAVPRLAAAVAGLDLRLYDDTWELKSITVEASWDQLHFDQRLRWRVHARYYQQSRASFYRDAGEANSYERAGPVGSYFTGDRELAPLGDLLLGASLGYRARATRRRLGRLFQRLEATLRLDLIKVFAFSSSPPNAPRTTGVVDALTTGLFFTGEF